MRNVIALVFATLLFGSSAAVQIPTKGNVYFGYSYYNTNLSSIDRGRRQACSFPLPSCYNG